MAKQKRAIARKAPAKRRAEAERPPITTVVVAPDEAGMARIRAACRELADTLKGEARPLSWMTEVGGKLYRVYRALEPYSGPFVDHVLVDPPPAFFTALDALNAVGEVEAHLAADAIAPVPPRIVATLGAIAGPATAQLEALAAAIVAVLADKGASMLVAEIADAVGRDEKTVRERLKRLADNGYVARLKGRKGFALTERGKASAANAPA